MNNWVIGIDLGATKIALGLLDPDSRIVARRRLLTGADEGPDAVVARIVQGVTELQSELPASAGIDTMGIDAVGICTPGPVDYKQGMLLDPPNMPGLHNTPLRQMLTDRLKVPVALEHDAKAAALGEYFYGGGRGERSMAYVVIGTGVGAAFILDGQLYRGLRNSAGEVGGMTIDRDAESVGALCGSGIRGCVQGYTCGPALAYHYQRLCEESGQQNAETVTGEQVAQLAAQGDAVASRVMVQAGEALGVMVGSLAMVLDIDLYIVGGSVVKAGDLLLAPARRVAPKYAFQSIGGHLRIAPAELGEDGPILGSGWLARLAVAAI